MYSSGIFSIIWKYDNNGRRYSSKFKSSVSKPKAHFPTVVSIFIRVDFVEKVEKKHSPSNANAKKSMQKSDITDDEADVRRGRCLWHGYTIDRVVRSPSGDMPTNTTCERSRTRGAILPALKTVLLKLSALPLATRPLVIARPCHASPTHQLSMSPATQRPTSPNSASGGHEKPLPGTARAPPRKVEKRKKLQTPPSSYRTAVMPL